VPIFQLLATPIDFKLRMHDNNNPLKLDGIEYVEYVTLDAVSFGRALEQLGFVATAKHRSREVVLYQQGGMNIIVNSDADAVGPTESRAPRIKAVALRVRDAAAAYASCVALGAWPHPPRVGAMELSIPSIRGVGDSVIYFVDRYEEFSIYDVDFKRLPTAGAADTALEGMHFFGVVQSIQEGRSREWTEFYCELLSFRALPKTPTGEYFGVLPRGLVLESPCGKFFLQLVEPPQPSVIIEWEEKFSRIGIGVANVEVAVAALKSRGIKFVEGEAVHTSERGAVAYLGGTTFEFVKSHLKP
jgi:4-hydroxyphenylpyruvate dioxygenase